MGLRGSLLVICSGGLTLLSLANGCGLFLDLPEPDSDGPGPSLDGGAGDGSVCRQGCDGPSGGAQQMSGGRNGSGGRRSSGGATSSGGDAGSTFGGQAGAEATGGDSSGGSSSGGSGGTSGGSGGTSSGGTSSGGSGGTASGGTSSGECLTPCDCDGDGYLAKSVACGGDDCDDEDPRVHPGQTGYFAERSPNEHVGFDYNCNGLLERDPIQGTSVLSCLDLNLLACTQQQGFNPTLPPCGQVGRWVECRGILGLCSAYELDAAVIARCR